MRWPNKRQWLAAGLTVAAAIRVAANVGAAPDTAIGPAAGTEPQLEQQFLALLNAERAQNALTPLVRDGRIDRVATNWSQHMAATYVTTGMTRDPAATADCSRSSLCHRPDLVAQLSAPFPDWTVVGENVGVGGEVAAINEAFLASPPHQRNIIGAYNAVGIGVTIGSGRIWVTVDFVNSPALVTAVQAARSISIPSAAVLGGLTAVGDFRARVVTPVRVIDTRSGIGGVRLRAGEEERFALKAAPGDAIGVQGNLTVADPAGAGYLTLYPCDYARPIASTVSWGASRTPIASAVAAPLGTGGVLCAFADVDTDLVLDVAGWGVAAGGAPDALGLTTFTPQRLLDSRSTSGPGQNFRVIVPTPSGPLRSGQAAVMNITVTDQSSAGFVTAWPCDQTMPLASNLNYQAGEARANLVASPVASDGSDCFYASSPVQFLVDLEGVQTVAGPSITGSVPLRLLDTRPAVAFGPWVGALAAGQQIEVAVGLFAPRGGMATVTAVSTGVRGYVTVWPCGQPRPDTSTLNVSDRIDEPVSNLVLFRTGADQRVCLYSSSPIQLLMDLNGETSP